MLKWKGYYPHWVIQIELSEFQSTEHCLLTEQEIGKLLTIAKGSHQIAGL